MKEVPPQIYDYYVGIVRGFLLALNANPQVVSAFDHICESYVSRAGEVIDVPPPKPKLLPAPKPEQVNGSAKEEAGAAEVFQRRWSDEETAILEANKEKPVPEIVKLLPGRKYGQVYSKLVGMGYVPVTDGRMKKGEDNEKSH